MPVSSEPCLASFSPAMSGAVACELRLHGLEQRVVDTALVQAIVAFTLGFSRSGEPLPMTMTVGPLSRSSIRHLLVRNFGKNSQYFARSRCRV